MRLGRHTFADDAMLVMAIVNRTPDSFYDKGATFAEPKHDHSSQPNEEQWAEALAASEKALEEIKNA